MQGADDPAGRVGDIVADKYLLLGLLGSGGMGSVFEAEHRFTGRRVAVKLMHPELGRNPSLADRFVREARAPCSIGHRGIVDVLDGGRDTDGSLYLVLELLEGETLGDAFKGGLDPVRFVQCIIELLEALDAAHQAGFVHRDIKPENVFLTDPASTAGGAVKLLDFGVVGTLTSELGPELTHTGAIVGTPLYMSPEQALGHKADARSDLWSVGAVMYRALANEPPFRGESYNAVIVSVASGEYTSLSTLRPELPTGLLAVVDRALQKDPARRWQRAGEMAEALRQGLDDPTLDPSRQLGPASTAAGGPAGRVRKARAAPLADTVPARGAPRPAGNKPTDPEVTPPAMTDVAAGAARRETSPGHAPARRAEPGGSPERLVWIGMAAIVASALAVGGAMLARPPAPHVDDAVVARATAPRPQDEAPAEPEPPAPAEAPAEETTGPVDDPGEPEPPSAEREAEAAPATGVTEAQLSEVVIRHRDQIRRCLVDATARTRSDEPSRLEVALSVSRTGRVTRAEVSGEGPEGLAACVERAATGWRFPEAGAESDVRFPILFEPKIEPL